MKIEFLEKDKPVKKTEFIEFLESAVHHYLGMWGITSTKYNILIDLDIQKDLYDYEDEGTPMGGTLQLEKDKFIIFINLEELKKSYGENSPVYWMHLMQILAHECTHVKQYIKNELSYDHQDRPLWMGKDISTKTYEKSPHEQEAYKYQEDMAIDFFISMGYAEIDDEK